MSELDKKTVAELKEHAEENGVDLTGITKKADIIAAIETATGDAPAEPAAEVDEPVAVEEVEKVVAPKKKPELTKEQKEALELRDAKSRKNPTFRRQEWAMMAAFLVTPVRSTPFSSAYSFSSATVLLFKSLMRLPPCPC